MHVLNVALGGRPAQPITGHTPASQAQAGPTGGASDVAGQARQRGRVYGAAPDNSPPGKRQVFLSPGAKLAYTIGGSGWVTVIDDHEHGIREADKADGVLASAYARDGVIEAIELPGRHWVIGVQWPAHRGAELPAGFDNLLLAFLERAG
jgi:putative glutamine amidotransferase